MSCEVCNFFDFEVSAVSNNSLNVKDNSVFVAVKGTETDGHKYINDAIARGARAVFHNQEIQKQSGVSYIRVEDSYYAYALLCEKYFDEPSKKLKLIGITGTNGKTTSAYLLKSVLESLGKKVGLLSTVEYSFGDRVISAQRTTPEAFELQTVFHKMVEADCEYCVMEVSSHALDQRRIGSARFDGVIFTNLSGDHLDYHKDMKSYFLAKERLFTEYLKKAGKAVTNCDDPYGKNLGVTTFGLSDISDYNIIPSRDLFSRCMDGIINSGETFILSPHLLGLYNSYNVAGVFALLSELGFNKQKVAHALSEKISVPGRLERICGRKNILYFVDYAHSDDALRRVLTALRELKPKKLISVFGCGGNRDKTKRPRMGKISAELADFTIVTSDNPRKEVPSEIIKDILEGIRITGVPPVNEKEDIHGRACPLPESARDARGTGKYNVIEDRRRAIFEAVRMAEEKDIVLIAGKGHEDYQEIMGVRYPFSDKEVLKKAINEVEGLRS
ncbi:MAG: UDP-N-acetylmuramoyl-L-alanyl-D-glutamate--2,6-diaminopimelate ligase [Lentisphaerae bacterium GWF2_38_69]|nr:MAG: UDP-N-acetylmuramoyl-L-alanyl-D-glutamate--2,6-diaminopimelate ligase [Lentisphaerae bacterium GWF2_38_69]